VTGSNCVNVFLGLGLPWSVGAIYWQVREWDLTWASRYPDIAKDHTDGSQMVFVVRSGDLAFSVCMFCFCALIALTVLVVRRRKIGAELGGPLSLKCISSFLLVLLWVWYIGSSFWWSFRKDVADKTEEMYVLLVGIIGLMVPLLVFLVVAARMPFYYDLESASEANPRNSAASEHKKGSEAPNGKVGLGSAVPEKSTLPALDSFNWHLAGEVVPEGKPKQNDIFDLPPYGSGDVSPLPIARSGVPTASETKNSPVGKVTPYSSQGSDSSAGCGTVRDTPEMAEPWKLTPYASSPMPKMEASQEFKLAV